MTVNESRLFLQVCVLTLLYLETWFDRIVLSDQHLVSDLGFPEPLIHQSRERFKRACVHACSHVLQINKMHLHSSNFGV